MTCVDFEERRRLSHPGISVVTGFSCKRSQVPPRPLSLFTEGVPGVTGERARKDLRERRIDRVLSRVVEKVDSDLRISVLMRWGPRVSNMNHK